MIEVNISGFDEIRNKIAGINVDKLCFDVATSLKAEIKHRVHVEGKASDGSQIGEYSKEYMKFRSGAFKNKRNNISRGNRKGEARPLGYGKRGTGTDVILSLSRQMEKDMDATAPIPIDGGFGIGYSNEFNYNKAIWNEKRYGKPIWSLTEKENQLARDIVSNYVDEINN